MVKAGDSQPFLSSDFGNELDLNIAAWTEKYRFLMVYEEIWIEMCQNYVIEL